MADRTIDTFSIKNIANQSIMIYIKEDTTSVIYDGNGHTLLKQNASLEVEQNRVDLQQLITLRKNKQIEYTPLKVRISESGSSL